MQLAQDILCGGATHSVYAVDPATGVLTQAATSDLPAVAHDSYQFHAVLQFIKIEGSVQELSELTEIIGWEPDAEILSLVDDVDGVESIHKMNSAEAAAAVACHDLDLFYPYMASAQDYYRNDAVYNCSELKVSCEDSTFRLICPHTCQCDVMDSGMYLRTGCSSTCDDLILAEVTSVMDSLYGIGEDSEKCTHANTAWMIPFLEELEVAFFAQDLLEERGADYVWSSSFRVAFMEFANSEYALEDVTLSGWLDISVDNGLCDAIILIDNLMQTDLCHTSQLSYSLGTLQGVCPQVCGLCGTDGVTDTRLSVSRLYDKQLSMLSSGLLKFKLFDSITGSRLVCGSSLQGAKAGQASVTYSYEPSPNEVVVFSLCSDYTDFDTTISIYDVDDLLVAYSDDDDAWRRLSVNS